MEGRKHTRFGVQLPVSFSGDQLSDAGMILNVSAEGCAIMSDTVAGVGVYLQFTRDDATPGARGSGSSRFGRSPVGFQDEVWCRVY